MTPPHSRTVLLKSTGEWRAVVEESSYAYPTFTTSALPSRVYTGVDELSRPAPLRSLEPEFDFKSVPSPLQQLVSSLDAPLPVGVTTSAVLKLEAAWLLTEDRFNLLDVGGFEPLPHQLSLVEHVVTRPDLTRLLIADEVGLGKTIETALIILRLSRAKGPGFRALYLTEARLVDNVVGEFERVGVPCRRWSVDAQEATLDPDSDEGVVVASAHRAVANEGHFARVEASGPWDLLVVDEAHHLSDWSEEGVDPQRRMKLVKRLLGKRLRNGGRLILLSGTPHQGHADKFKNVLRLLDENLKDERCAAGRVIYRIKDDIHGWDGQPLFPRRNVLPPTMIDTPPSYQRWLAAVSTLLSPEAGHRAAAWRRSQALEWCASSPEAGLAYLVRLALRSGLNSRIYRPLTRGLEALRPYRGGPPDEPADSLEARLQSLNAEEGTSKLDRAAFENVIDLGVELVRGDLVGTKIRKMMEWFDADEREKFVVFAQPIDTVHLILRRLQQALGSNAVSLVVGGQSGEQRTNEIQRFCTSRRSRVLVSSRSGGEGINLQVSRNLVHFDVPWNPMELEQRVGRVHRYGGFKTVNVHTLVLSGSREERVLGRCRARLGQVVRDLDLERREELFARTMSMIPIADLEQLMAGENLGPLRPDEEARLDKLVQDGVKQWLDSDAEFRKLSEQLPELKRGPVRNDDLAAFLSRAPGFAPVEGWVRESRSESSEDFENVQTPAFLLPDGSVGSAAPAPGEAVREEAGTAVASPVGLNTSSVAQAARDALLPPPALSSSAGRGSFGHGSVALPLELWEAWNGAGLLPPGSPESVLFFAYLVKPFAGIDDGGALRCFVGSIDGKWETALDENATAAVVRLLRSARPEQRLPAGLDAREVIQAEERRIDSLAHPSEAASSLAVFPIAAVAMRPDGG